MLSVTVIFRTGAVSRGSTGKEPAKRNCPEESDVRLHGRNDLVEPDGGTVHHDEPRLRGTHGAAGEPQGSVSALRNGRPRSGTHLRNYAGRRRVPRGETAGTKVHHAI